MRCRVEPIWLTAHWAGRQTIGKVIRVGADVGKIVRRPGAGVQVELLNRDIDLSPIVRAALIFRVIGSAYNARNDYRREDPQDRHDGEQLHERERSSILVTAVHDKIRYAIRCEGNAQRSLTDVVKRRFLSIPLELRSASPAKTVVPNLPVVRFRHP